MSTKYIQKLADMGKGSIDELEKQWDKAKKKAKKRGQEKNYPYVTRIFQKMIGEAFDRELQALQKEVPDPGFEQLTTPTAQNTFQNHIDNIEKGKYKMKCDDHASGFWKKGDIVDVEEPICPKKDIGGLPAYEISINNVKVYILKDFMEQITEDGDGGGDGGSFGDSGVSTTTSDIAGYEVPFKMRTRRRSKPDQLLWGGDLSEEEEPSDDCELDEDGTDFSWTWGGDMKSQPKISDDVRKQLKVWSPDLAKQKKKALRNT